MVVSVGAWKLWVAQRVHGLPEDTHPTFEVASKFPFGRALIVGIGVGEVVVVVVV